MKLVRGYAVAAAAVGACLLLVVRFGAELQPHTYALFLCTIVVTALAEGLGPAIAATVLSVAATNYLEYLQFGRLRIDLTDAVQLATLAAIALGISVVVAQRQRAERKLAAANAELLELDRAKDQLIASVSHELRTPATVILGWSELLRESDDPALLRTALPAMEAAARAQARLIEDLLDMSRLILGKLRLETAPTALVSVVRNAVEMVQPLAAERGVTVRASLPSDPCIVDGDAVRLQQICWNLLSNAVKFTPAGGSVDVVLSHGAGAAEIAVTDTGEGIDAELLPHIFEPLRQAAGAMAKGGLGLGLAIVGQLVAMHHGTIEAKSAGKGKGATFVVRLPQSDSGA